MSAASLPGLDGGLPEVNYSCVPDPIADDPGATPAFVAVVRALVKLASGGYEVIAYRRDIAATAHVSERTVARALQWLQDPARPRPWIEILGDNGTATRRRFVLLWRRSPGRRQTPPPPQDDTTHQRPAASHSPASVPLSPGSVPHSHPSVPHSPASVPLSPGPSSIVKKKKEEDKTVSSRLVSSGPRAHARPTGGDDETGRDETMESRGEGEEEAEARRLIAEVRALGYHPQIVGDDRVKLRGHDSPEPDPAVPWEALEVHKPAIMARLRAEAEPRPRTSPEANGDGRDPPPARVDPDESYPLAAGLALVDALPETVEAFVGHFLGRWRDDGNETTVRTFTAAGRTLTPDVLRGLVDDAERPGVRSPGRHFASAASDELGRARKRGKARP